MNFIKIEYLFNKNRTWRKTSAVILLHHRYRFNLNINILPNSKT